MVTKIKKGLIYFSASLGLQEVYSCGSGSVESVLSKYYIDQKVNKDTASEGNCKILKDLSTKIMLAIDAFYAEKSVNGTKCKPAIADIKKFITEAEKNTDSKNFIDAFIAVVRSALS